MKNPRLVQDLTWFLATSVLIVIYSELASARPRKSLPRAKVHHTPIQTARGGRRFHQNHFLILVPDLTLIRSQATHDCPHRPGTL